MHGFPIRPKIGPSRFSPKGFEILIKIANVFTFSVPKNPFLTKKEKKSIKKECNIKKEGNIKEKVKKNIK